MLRIKDKVDNKVNKVNKVLVKIKMDSRVKAVDSRVPAKRVKDKVRVRAKVTVMECLKKCKTSMTVINRLLMI